LFTSRLIGPMSEHLAVTPEQLLADGWYRFDQLADFSATIGAFWLRGENEPDSMGMLITKALTNTHIGTLHGGALMTFADMALGMGVANCLGEKRNSTATTALNTQFVAKANVGEFLSCTPEVVRRTRHLVFVRGILKAGDRVIANCDGIWTILGE